MVFLAWIGIVIVGVILLSCVLDDMWGFEGKIGRGKRTLSQWAFGYSNRFPHLYLSVRIVGILGLGLLITFIWWWFFAPETKRTLEAKPKAAVWANYDPPPLRAEKPFAVGDTVVCTDASGVFDAKGVSLILGREYKINGFDGDSCLLEGKAYGYYCWRFKKKDSIITPHISGLGWRNSVSVVDGIREWR